MSTPASPAPGSPAASVTARGLAKADRRSALLRAAATLFAERGYHNVSLEDLGAAAGVRGPAVYRHFEGKQAVLAALLVGVSKDLLAGGRRVVADALGDEAALAALVAFHVDFALTKPDVISVQDRDLGSLRDVERRRVRHLQREYVELWVAVLSRLHEGAAVDQLRMRAHATFGLINSTPHSTRLPGTAASGPAVHDMLERMALAALGA